MDFSLTTDHISSGEKIGFGIAILGVAILLALTIKSSLQTGVTPTIEQQIFSITFILTLSVTIGVVISHYTESFAKFIQKIKPN